MKHKEFTITVVALGLIMAAAQQPAVAKKGGTSILHFLVRTTLNSTGVDPDASGSVNAKQNAQGNADNQRLQLVVANLDASTTYKLLATSLDETNLLEVAEFDTDTGGAANLKFVKKKTGKASPGGEPLPDGLIPLSSIRSLVVSAGGTQDVLVADLGHPDKLQYLIKRAMTNDGVDDDAAAALRIKATQSVVQFRIRASGLDPSSEYHLAINGDIAETDMSDANGNLNINSLPDGAPNVLDISLLAILDSTSNSVLSTSFP